jgi:hypothetical protein
MFPRQDEVDTIVERCRVVAETYGGRSDELAELRKYYQIFRTLPEGGAFAMLDWALKRVE